MATININILIIIHKSTADSPRFYREKFLQRNDTKLSV